MEKETLKEKAERIKQETAYEEEVNCCDNCGIPIPNNKKWCVKCEETDERSMKKEIKEKIIKGWTIKASNKNSYGKHIYIPHWIVEEKSGCALLVIVGEESLYAQEDLKVLKDKMEKRGFKGRLKIVPCEITLKQKNEKRRY